MLEFSIRRAGSGDAEAVARIGAATFGETFGHLYPADDLRSFLAESHGVNRARADLADPRRALWLAEIRGRPVGYALAGPCTLPHPEVAPACGEVHRLYLLREAQGMGAGARLFDLAVSWLQATGRGRIWIGVWSENFGAQRFYARRGFEKVGEYDFPVGRTRDREFILRREAESSPARADGGDAPPRTLS